MSEADDKTRAFPLDYTVDNRRIVNFGMSLRAWYAGQALPAVIAATSAGQHNPTTVPGDDHIRMGIARDAFLMADAMLAVEELPSAAHSTPTFTDTDLFNCWAGGVSPTPEEVARFSWLEVGGVRDVNADEGWSVDEHEERDTHMEGCDDEHAEFWSVYARYRPTDTHAGCECITDGPPGDKARAWAIAEHLGKLWGLPVNER